MPIRDVELRWLLQGLLTTTEPHLAEHRGFARALLTMMGQTRGRKPKRAKTAKKR